MTWQSPLTRQCWSPESDIRITLILTAMLPPRLQALNIIMLPCFSLIDKNNQTVPGNEMGTNMQ